MKRASGKTGDIVEWAALGRAARRRVLQRPQAPHDETFGAQVAAIIAEVRTGGDKALFAATRRFDGVTIEALEVPRRSWAAANAALDPELGAALDNAAAQIEDFHRAGRPTGYRRETWPGLTCAMHYRPLARVGLYVPGGSAPLFSTLLMLAIPASLAGCGEIVVCTPPRRDGEIDPVILAVAARLGVDRLFRIGGAQAIAALAYGTETVPCCAKLFGPGNRWVTEAKRQVAADPGGAAIDLPAGPSEVLVLAASGADARFIACDLIAQAEHGPDSQVLLVTDDHALAERVQSEVTARLGCLPRAAVARAAFAHARWIVVPDLETGLAVSNEYAPEHLILHVPEAERWLDRVQSAGSVFAGEWTPETLGDYCSGTNHVLPTGGEARRTGALGVADFMRRMTSQCATREGLAAAGPTAIALAAAEGLEGHRQAVAVRLEA